MSTRIPTLDAFLPLSIIGRGRERQTSIQEPFGLDRRARGPAS